ncbi:hypothetical protein BC834DRAFT_290404 [Gloeopeniophorella convolvens]|nr:hypothetical protein BC834DRAFT_290404 [Gloeopeniophorella convolvens]
MAVVTARDDTLPDVEALDVAYLGPFALSTFIGAVEMGILWCMYLRFLLRPEERKESLCIRVMVGFVMTVAFFQTGTSFATWWKLTVTDFGNWTALGVPSWPQEAQRILTTFMATPVQLFLIWRCWHLLKRRWFVAAPLVLLVIGTNVTTFLAWATVLLTKFKGTHTTLPSFDPYFVCFVISVACPAVTDIAVTGILLVFLIRSRSSVYTRRFRRRLEHLITITWESAAPPCVCALAALFACIHEAPFVSFWAVMIQTILGKLYLISLFVILECRSDLATAEELTHFPTLTEQLDGEQWPITPGADPYRDRGLEACHFSGRPPDSGSDNLSHMALASRAGADDLPKEAEV